MQGLNPKEETMKGSNVACHGDITMKPATDTLLNDFEHQWRRRRDVLAAVASVGENRW